MLGRQFHLRQTVSVDLMKHVTQQTSYVHVNIRRATLMPPLKSALSTEK